MVTHGASLGVGHGVSIKMGECARSSARRGARILTSDFGLQTSFLPRLELEINGLGFFCAHIRVFSECATIQELSAIALPKGP